MDYNEYIRSSKWYKLKHRLIYSNDNSSCYICGSKYPLFIHHIDYNNLGKEQPLFLWFGDVIVVCEKCHKKLHFRKFLFFWNTKIPLQRSFLLRRVFELKIITDIQKGKLLSAFGNFFNLFCTW